MESKALQELVRKIFSDEKTKANFISDPQSVLSHFSLTEQEKQAVLHTYQRVGLATGNSQQLESSIGPMVTWL